MRFLAGVVCAVSALSSGGFARQAPYDSPAPLAARVAVIGASASAGFHARVTLAEALDVQIAVAHTPPANFADEALFLDPGALGEAQVARAAALDPTLVVAADFLFWFGYGEVAAESERLENLEFGLELFDELRCPLVISRFPDMSAAVGKMLLPTQMPKPETLVKLDQRLELWAAKRGRVAFVPMPEYVAKLRTGELCKVGELEIQGPDWKRRLMQRDELHPTAEGLGVLARLCLDAACTPAIGAKPAEFAAELAPALARLKALEAERAPAKRKLEPQPKPAPPAPPERPGRPGHPERPGHLQGRSLRAFALGVR